MSRSLWRQGEQDQDSVMLHHLKLIDYDYIDYTMIPHTNFMKAPSDIMDLIL